jgi:two-component system sensor histidine kinase PilS (NtrC family)
MNAALLKRIQWMMALRVILSTLLLSLPPLLGLDVVKGAGPMPPFYLLIALTYLLTLIGVAFMARGIRNPRTFSICQLAIDLLLETALIAVTGGAESPFIFLYIISIVAGSLLFQLEGGLLTASCATFLLSVLAGFQQIRPLPFQTPTFSGEREAIYLILLYAVSFFFVGAISGRLSQRLHERETGLLDLRLLHENIVQSITSGLVTTDMTGRITSLNRHATLITGFTPQEAIGTLWWELFRWDAIKNHYDAILTSSLARRFEGELRTRDGRRCLLGVTLSILSNEAAVKIGMTGIFQDLTRLRHLEEQMEKKARMALIGEMAAGIAHEIRNPLAALSGSLQLLRESSGPRDEAGKLMQIALEETERLDDIVTQFLSYAKPPPTHRRPADLHLLLSEAVRLLENSRADDRRIQVRLLTAPGPLILLIDPDQIRQLFWNLSVNAFQAMPGGGTLTIATRTQCMEGEAQEVEIRFSDTGVGIAPDDLPNIFNPFFTTKGTGSGLGLSIVQRIVEGHAGHVEVRNGEQGASFFVTLPAPSLEHGEEYNFKPQDKSQGVFSIV